MEVLTDAIDQVVAGLDGVLRAEGVAALTDAARMDVLRGAGEALRRVEAIIVEAVASADPRFPDEIGCRSMNELLQRVLGIDATGAARVTKAASAVRREVAPASGERLPPSFPALRAAMLDGVLGVCGVLAATTPIVQSGHRIGTEDRLAADAALADLARGLDDVDEIEASAASVPAASGQRSSAAPPATPDDLRQHAQVLVLLLDPDGAEPTDQKACRRRFVTIGRLHDGVHSLRGSLLPDAAAQLQLIIDAQCNPKTGGPPAPGVTFREVDDPAAGGGEAEADLWNSDPRNVIDPRTAAQRRHDALSAALAIAARHEDMPRLAGASPTLVVHADLNDVAHGAGWATVAGSSAMVPIGVAVQAACTGAIQRVLFDEGRIVGVAVTDRVFTVHQRRAIIARDRECLIPGCHVPAPWCEIHHVVEHARGGPTTTDNGVPLCWWHHRSLGRSGWEIRMVGGIPQIRGPAWWDPDRRWRGARARLPVTA